MIKQVFLCVYLGHLLGFPGNPHSGLRHDTDTIETDVGGVPRASQAFCVGRRGVEVDVHWLHVADGVRVYF